MTLRASPGQLLRTWTYFFFVGVSCWVISDCPGKETQNWPLYFILYDQTFLSEPGTINCPASRFNDTQLQAISNATNNTLLFYIDWTSCSKHRVSKRITRHNSVSVIKRRCAIERKLPRLLGEKESRIWMRQMLAATIFRKYETPPSNINLLPRHVTIRNQDLSSLAPFGVGT